MADDKLDLVVEISAHTRGLEGAAREASLANDAIESLSRAGEIGEEVLKAYSVAGEKVSSALGGIPRTADAAAGSFEAMSQDVQRLNAELRESARLLVEQGNLNPKASLAAGMTDSVAAEAKAVLEAEKISVDGIIAERERASRAKEALIQREAAIYNDYLEHQYKGEQRAAQNTEKVRAEQSKIYNDYLEHQFSHEEKVRAKQNKLYDDYLSHQAKADADYRAQMDAGAARLEKIQADRLAGETKEFNRQMESRVKTQQDSLKGLNYDAHVKEYQKLKDAKQAASEQDAIYNDYLWHQADALRRAEEQTISLRYANYDLASTMFATSAAITAVGAASLVAFAQQESAFTEVERIAGGSLQEIQNLRDELQAMSTDIPVAFGELSNIASLGAALDIPADQLDEFTESVAKFAATTGVTVEAAATGFGKLAAYLQIPEEQFDALGSAILRAGNISVATEEQVLKFAQALALPGARIGFTTDQVVALGATLASFGNINVEGAGSALNRVTKNIERALSENGEALQTWAATAGMSAESFRVAWGSDVSGTFNRVIQGLSGNIEGLVGNLDALGIRNIRDQRIIEALALNYDKYNQILGETTSAWREGTYMNEAYGLVLDDLASKFQIMLNAFSNFAAAVGAELAPAFGTLVDLVTQALVGLTDFINSPIGGTITRTVALLAGLAAGYAALRGVIALATASTYAFSFVTRGLGGAGIGSALVGMIKAFAGIKTAADGATASTLTLRGALLALGRAVIIGAIFSYVAEWIFNTGEAAVSAGNAIGNFADFLLQTGQAINDFFGWGDASTDPVYKAIRGWSNGLKSWGKDLIAQKRNSDEALKGVGALSGGLDELDRLLEDVANNSGGAAGGIGDVGNAAAAAAQQIRTLVDYAGDLSGVWQRAFDIRFGGAQGLDTIRSTFISIRDAADEAAKRIRDLKNDISGLSSDIDIQEYFLSIAVEYGDTQRAAAIEADLAKKRAELADKTAELQKQQDAASMSLVGTSKGAIDNRQQILELVSQYQSYLQALAASGLSQGALAAKSEQLRQEFLAQAMDLGYSREELRLYEAAFIDTARIISAVPFGVTTDLSSLDPALLAIREFVDAANRDLNTLGSGMGGALGGGVGSALGAADNALKTGLPIVGKNASFMANHEGRKIGDSTSAGVGDGVNNPTTGINARVRSATVITAPVTTNGFNMGSALASALSRGISAYFDSAFPATSQGRTARNIIRQTMGFADGGYTGAGGRNEPAGIVHRGEYVIPKNMVNQSTGLPYADALGRLMTGIPGMASGGPTTGSGAGSSLATVALTPGTIQAIAQATGKVIVLDGRVIADSSANSYSQDNVVGRY